MSNQKAYRNFLIFAVGGVLGLVAIYLKTKVFTVRNRAVKKAIEEWKEWGEQTVDIYNKTVKEGSKEYDPEFVGRVGKYWNEGVGLKYDGNDRDVAWSSAFISWLWKKAGADNKFKYSASHSNYIYDSVKNRWDQKINAPFVAYRTSEVVPEIGDMVSYSRESSTDMYSVPAPYKSHTDIVVDKGNGYIDVIGGNVGQGVTKRRLRINDEGFLMDTKNKWFAIIKSNI